MSDVNIARSLFSFVIDAQIDGLSTSVWTTTSGTPSVTSNKYRLNNAAIRSNFQILFGETVFPVTIPTAPTAGHARRLGYRTYGPSGKGAVYFDVTDAVLTAKLITNAGTTFSEQIVWNAAWTNTQTDFRLGWDEKGAVFTVGTGSNKAQVTIPVGITEYLNVPAYLVVESTVADNMELPHVILNNVGRVASLAPAVTVSQSTASSLNAQVVGNVASDAADSGNPVKVGLKVNVTSPTFTDGDRADLQGDINGFLKNREQYAPVYENNVTGKAEVEHKYTNARVTADGQVKASAGFVHTVTLSATGAVTAGVITLYNNTAESGTVLWSGTAQVAMNPVTIILDVEASTGLYVGYDGTVANVATSVSYR